MQREDDFKINRQELVIHIRKQNRQQIFLKRRHLQDQLSSNITQNSTIPSPSQKINTKKYEPVQIDQLCSALNHQIIQIRLQSAIYIKNILSEQQYEQYHQRVVDNDVIPKLITYMLTDQCLQLRILSCEILTHLIYASSSHCQSIIQKQGIDAFMTLLYENNPPLILQALWALGNIAGDCHKCRDKVILKGGVDCVIRIISNYPTSDVAKIGIWVLSNISRGNPSPSYDLIKQAIPIFGSVIVRGLVEGNYLQCALWSLYTHSEGSKSKIRRIIQTQNLIAKIIQICYSSNNQLVIPALRILGNISTGSKNQTDELLNNHCIALLKKLINHKKRSIRRQSCWILSNICAGTQSQVQKCIFYPDLMPKLAEMLLTDEHAIRREICYIFGNMCHLGHPVEVYQVVTENHILEGLYLLIEQDDEVQTIEKALLCLYELLTVGAKINEKNAVLLHIQRIPGFIDRLESLQYHLSNDIYHQLTKILQRFFLLEEDQF